MAAKQQLKFPPVCFTGIQARAIGVGFARAAKESDYRILACSILPEHVHIVSARHERDVERIIGHLKARATQQLVADELHPFVGFANGGRFPSVWTDRAWKVFLNSQTDVDKAIEYVLENPVKEGKREQRWSFVQD